MSLLDTASLVITPNGYKEGKLYSVVPSDGSGDLNVTRATTATRVNASGLVELVPYNLLTYSEQLDNGAWTTFNASVTANTTTAPNGTTTADTITSNDSGGGDVYRSITVNGTYTLSAYFKAGTTNLCRLGSTASGLAEFNLSTETYTLLSGVSASITSVGSGWYRCTLTINNTSSTLLFLSSYDVTGKTVYAWGAQLVEGSTAKDYQKTETRLNIPRLDYSNGTCPSILVEPQRTNLLTYSEQFDNAAWTKTNVTITANSTDSPDGTTNADTLTKSGTGVDGTIVRVVSATATGYVGSIFVKKDTNTSRFPEFFLRSSDAAGENEIYVQLNTSTGATSIRLQFGTVSVSTPVLINGYWRLSFYALANSNTCRFGIRPAAGTTLGVFNANATGSIIAWGAQLEAGSYATSYIPTTSASVTRNADVISKTGISSLIGQTSGTVFLDINIDSSFAQDDMRFLDISDGSSANWYFIGTNNTNEFRFYFKAGGSVISTLTPFTSGRNKMAFAYANNDYVIYINGVQIYSTTTATVGSTSELNLGKGFSGSSFKQFTNSVALWKTRLTNTQLASLTTI